MATYKLPPPSKIPETEEEIQLAVLWAKQEGLLPDRKMEVNAKIDFGISKALDKIPDEDVRDLLALHGAGTFGRQLRAHIRRDLARDWGTIVFFIILVALSPVIVSILILIHFAPH